MPCELCSGCCVSAFCSKDPFSHFDFDGVLGLGLESLALSAPANGMCAGQVDATLLQQVRSLASLGRCWRRIRACSRGFQPVSENLLQVEQAGCFMLNSGLPRPE